MILYRQWHSPRNLPSTSGLNVRHLHYIATRPGTVYNHGQAFGLWGQLPGEEGPSVQRDLVKAKGAVKAASEHHTIYRAVFSVNLEDAEDYGLYHRQRWEALLKSHMDIVAKEMNIAPQDFCWVASFHKEVGHPHVHVMYWDKGTGIQPEGLSPERMEIMSERVRAEFGKDVYRDDIHREQLTQHETTAEMRTQLQALFREANPEKSLNIRKLLKRPETQWLADELLDIVRAVPKTGSLRYAFLPEEVKQKVDALTDHCIAATPELTRMVDEYKNATKQISDYYGNGEGSAAHNMIKAMGKLRKELGNEVMNTVRDVLASDTSFLQYPTSPQAAAKLEVPDGDANETSPQVAAKLSEGIEFDDIMVLEQIENSVTPEAMVSGSWAGLPKDIHVADNWWSADYKAARKLMYSDKLTDDSLQKAMTLFETEAQKGNGFAMYDRGQMCLKGLGCEKDEQEAQRWFRQAFRTMTQKEAVSSDKGKVYLQYRLGKLYVYGHGIEKDMTQAAALWEKASNAGNTFAAYSLAGLYRRGEGVERDDVRAFELYHVAADDGNAYAAYALGGMYAGGCGTEVSASGSQQYYQQAYQGFESLVRTNPDDKLFYRLGRMNLDGVGTSVNIEQAAEYFRKAVDLENDDARYGLARLYLTHDYYGYDPTAAKKLLEEAAENDHALSQYLLGKLLLQGDEFPHDPVVAEAWLMKAVSLDNASAGAILGKAYLEGTALQQDIDKALELLNWAIEKENSQASYILGKAYLAGDILPADPMRAEQLLQCSSDMGNQYAAVTLAKAYIEGADLPKDIWRGLKLLDEPARAGNVAALYLQGKTLVTEDTVLDMNKGILSLMEAASQGSDPAELQLGILYFFGKEGLLEQDKNKGLDYLRSAAEHGNEFAQELLNSISRSQIANMLCGFMHLGSQMASQQKARAALGSYRKTRELSKEAKRDIREKKSQEGGFEQDL